MTKYHEVGLLNLDSKHENYMLLESSTAVRCLVFNPLNHCFFYFTALSVARTISNVGATDSIMN